MGISQLQRVHHGIVNAEKQPVYNEDKSLLIFMDGEVYGYEDEKQFLIKKGPPIQV
jgi:asparagine synthetase B (glutamine-hydrolysing)